MRREQIAGMSHLHPNRADHDQVFQKYLDRAITDINGLAMQVAACGNCDHDSASRALGTGHPLADIMLLKWAPERSELEEGVAFYGRAGDAIMRSAQRLQLDPLDLYGTNCIKCASEPTRCMVERCPGWLRRELCIVDPRLLVVMGEPTVDAVNALGMDGAAHLVVEPARLQPWTHACDVLWCPDIDASLDRPASKQAFWRAFRAIGDWQADRPPW